MHRRSFLASAAASAASAAACSTPAPPDRRAAEIKVSGIEIFPLRVNERGNWVVIRLHSDAGLTGIGDASHAGRDDPQIAKLEEYAELMKGRSIYDVEWLRGKAHAEYAEYRRATSCSLSAIEQALFDIQGQAASVPCWALFGGKLHQEIRNYANINRGTSDRTPKGFAANAESAVAAGFDALKMAPFDGMPRDGSAAEIAAHTKLGVECAFAAREVLGPDRDLLIDAHSNFDLERGLAVIKELEPLNLFWLEELTRPVEVLAELDKAAPMPTAGGESLFGIEQNFEYIRHKPVDILMPDVKYVGGMSELKKVAAMAEAAGMEVAPHGPASPVGNLAAMHVCASMPNQLILEFSHSDAPWRAELLDPPEELRNGRLRVPDGPGMGVKLNEKTLAARKTT